MKSVPTILDLATGAFVSLAIFLVLFLIMKFITVRFFDGDEKRLEKYCG